MDKRFIADVHLGKLARMLRMLGVDTAYKNTYTNAELVSIALNENRILLSRNIAFKKNDALLSFVVQGEEPTEQLKQVIKHFNLKKDFQPFTKCIVCNGDLYATLKENIIAALPSNTKEFYHEFWQCSDCSCVYWKGSHYERMQKLLEGF